MPTNRLPIKFSKNAFLNILKYAIKRACLFVCNQVLKQPQRSFGKTNPVKRIVQASWFTNRIPPDETYRGVEIVVHSLVVGLETRLTEYSYIKCLYNKPTFTSKNGRKKCTIIASTDILNFKIFSGEIPRPPLREGEIPSSRALPRSRLRHSRNAYAVQWPYHFSKTDDGPV